MQKLTKNIVISGTNFWNVGDDFVRDGIIEILKEVFIGADLNFMFYNFGEDFLPPSKFKGVGNFLSSGDLEQYKESIDYVVIAGLSAGREVKPLFEWVLKNNLQSKVCFIGAGYENDYVDKYISKEPFASVFKSAKFIIGRTKKRPAFLKSIDTSYYHVNCPAILSAGEEKVISAGSKIVKIAFSIQLPDGIGIDNHKCSDGNYVLITKVLKDFSKQYDVEIITHHKTEYFHFLNNPEFKNIRVRFSSFYQDIPAMYKENDMVITTRLHAGLFANGLGLPSIIVNDTDRHTHTLDGFPFSVWVKTKSEFETAFKVISAMDLSQTASLVSIFKKSLKAKYVKLISKHLNVYADPNMQMLAEKFQASLVDVSVKKNVLNILKSLSADKWLKRNIINYQAAIKNKEGWFDSLVFLNWYGKNIKPKNYLEVGVRRGRSMVQILKNSPKTKCYGFDMWISDYGDEVNAGPVFLDKEFKKIGIKQKPKYIIGNSHKTLDTFFKNKKNLQKFDLMFIDGDHSYSGAKLDLETAFDHLADGGVMLFDDICNSACRHLYILWQEYMIKYPEMLFLTDKSGNGTAIAAKPPFTELSKFLKFKDIKNIKQYPVLENYKSFMLSLKDVLPINFFTIVLNGMPFLEKQIKVFSKLKLKWHWHIIEGAAELKKDTAWSKCNGGFLKDDTHKNGLSIDGTTEVINALVKKYPQNITVYRPVKGKLWQGKIEMINAPLTNIKEKCLLFQIDVDEFWDAKQITDTAFLFKLYPFKHSAKFYCNYYVGENLITVKKNAYGNNTDYEWDRVWRYEPGDTWDKHEPPVLMRKIKGSKSIDVGCINPFTHLETLSHNLVFHHFAYFNKKQLEFKETYYGYKEAVTRWQKLINEKNMPQKLKSFFHWVDDKAMVDFADLNGVDKYSSSVKAQETIDVLGYYSAHNTSESVRFPYLLEEDSFMENAKSTEGEDIYHKGYAYREKGDFEKAKINFTNFLKVKNSDRKLKLNTLIYLGEMHVGRNDKESHDYFKQAVKFIAKSKKISEEDRYLEASLYKKMDNVKKAENIFSNVLKKTDSLRMKSGACFHLGDICSQQKDYRNAKIFLEKCLDINPNHIAAKKILDAIKKV